MLGFSYNTGLSFNLALAILSKFASIVLLSLALDEYQNLNANGTYLIFSIYCCLAPTCLLTPVYTYDHVRCMARNFIITNSVAQRQCFFSLLMFLIPFVFGLIIPNTWTKMFCYPCKRRQAQKVEAIVEEGGKDPIQQKKKRTTTETLSLAMVYFINTVAFGLILGFLYGLIVVHVFQYKLTDGELLNSGGLNEIVSLIYLLIISGMHYQREVTQTDI